MGQRLDMIQNLGKSTLNLGNSTPAPETSDGSSMKAGRKVPMKSVIKSPMKSAMKSAMKSKTCDKQVDDDLKYRSGFVGARFYKGKTIYCSDKGLWRVKPGPGRKDLKHFSWTKNARKQWEEVVKYVKQLK